MSIKPVHFNGMMQRSQDISTIKQNEDQRPVVQQQNIQANFERKTEGMVKTVKQSEQKQDANGHFDAKEEGKNKYFSNRKKQEKPVLKNQVVEKRPLGGFDVTV